MVPMVPVWRRLGDGPGSVGAMRRPEQLWIVDGVYVYVDPFSARFGLMREGRAAGGAKAASAGR